MGGLGHRGNRTGGGYSPTPTNLLVLVAMTSQGTDQDAVHPPGQLLAGCGSSTSALEDTEPLRVWKAMKQNGFLSSLHGGIPIPKQQAPLKKRKNNAIKKKIDLAKREQVNKFAKIAAPSGLLSGLNPGIINHVRNSKQVHSIIEALVKSEKTNCHIEEKLDDHSGSMVDKCNRNEKDQDSQYGDYKTNRYLGAGGHIFLNHMSEVSSLGNGGKTHTSEVADATVRCEPSAIVDIPARCQDGLKLKILSASETTSFLSSGDFSGNQASIASLSLKAAAVASQWLELLHQDIRGRLAALRRSKKRARTMIQTELPFLLSQEFISGQENISPCHGQSSTSSDAHVLRWKTLFIKMETALLEEGKNLEGWLRQVKEMQEHCEHGLQFFHHLDQEGLQQLTSSNLVLNKVQALERESAVRAAAASIYSTCNLVMTAENVPCF